MESEGTQSIKQLYISLNREESSLIQKLGLDPQELIDAIHDNAEARRLMGKDPFDSSVAMHLAKTYSPNKYVIEQVFDALMTIFKRISS